MGTSSRMTVAAVSDTAASTVTLHRVDDVDAHLVDDDIGGVHDQRHGEGTIPCRRTKDVDGGREAHLDALTAVPQERHDRGGGGGHDHQDREQDARSGPPVGRLSRSPVSHGALPRRVVEGGTVGRRGAPPGGGR